MAKKATETIAEYLRRVHGDHEDTAAYKREQGTTTVRVRLGHLVDRARGRPGASD